MLTLDPECIDVYIIDLGDMQAKRLLAKKKAAAQKKSATSAAALAAAREAKERAKKAKGKKDTSHFNQVRLPLSRWLWATTALEPTRAPRRSGIPCQASRGKDEGSFSFWVPVILT